HRAAGAGRSEVGSLAQSQPPTPLRRGSAFGRFLRSFGRYRPTYLAPVPCENDDQPPLRISKAWTFPRGAGVLRLSCRSRLILAKVLARSVCEAGVYLKLLSRHDRYCVGGGVSMAKFLPSLVPLSNGQVFFGPLPHRKKRTALRLPRR